MNKTAIIDWLKKLGLGCLILITCNTIAMLISDTFLSVEKIHSMDRMICINFYSEAHKPIETKIYNWGMGDPQNEFESQSAIESVYKAVVAFIKWYNTQPKAE